MYVTGVKHKLRTYDKELLSPWWKGGHNGSSKVAAWVGDATHQKSECHKELASSPGIALLQKLWKQWSNNLTKLQKLIHNLHWNTMSCLFYACVFNKKATPNYKRKNCIAFYSHVP